MDQGQILEVASDGACRHADPVVRQLLGELLDGDFARRARDELQDPMLPGR
jgi:hypothetical protein